MHRHYRPAEKGRPNDGSIASGPTARVHSDEGVSILGLVLVVVILGIMVAITLSGAFSSTPTPSTSLGATTTTAPKTVASGASAATLAACEANYASILQAASTYQALNGVAPPSGTAWATAHTDGGPFLQSWPHDLGVYELTWTNGELTVTPSHGTPSRGSFGSASPATGCFAAAR